MYCTRGYFHFKVIVVHSLLLRCMFTFSQCHDFPNFFSWCVLILSWQRWCGSFVPHWLWVKAVLYNHTKTRREIKLARERNHERQFTRRRHYIPPNHERARYNSTESRIPDLTLRRTPSPKRKISTIESPGSPKAFKKLATTPVTSEFLDNQPSMDDRSVGEGATPTRPLSAGLHPTIFETKAPMTSTPLEGGAFPSPGGTGALGGFRFNGSTVRRLSNSSAALVTEHSGRRRSVVKVSRVLVIPSVARVSHHSSRSRSGSPHPPPHSPVAATPTEADWTTLITVFVIRIIL